MDILNFISWIRGKRQVTTVDPAKTLLPVGLKDERRDDEYLAGAISVQDFASQLGGLQTVAVDGVTITGNGTSGNPLETTGPKSYVANISQTAAFNPGLNSVFNTTGLSLTFNRTGPGVYESNIVNIPVSTNFITFTCSNGEAGSNGVGTTIFTQVSSAGGSNKYFTIITFANTTNGINILTTGNNDGLLKNAIIEINIYN
jgi:hypothetical protein